MTSLRWQVFGWVVALACMAAVGQAFAQPGPPFGRGRGGPGQDPQFVADRDVFHFLLGNHDQIRRQVTQRPDGVETVTESDKPEIAAKIQEHLAAMYRRVEEGRPIHMRDPLFAAVFQHAEQIELKFEKTEKGVKVVETSKDPYVAKLIQAHAEVVNLFVKKGFGEPHKNHVVPAAATAAKPADEPNTVAAACPNAASCPAGKQCPKAAAAGTGCQTCPKAANCPAGAACPNAASCAAGKQCPKAAAAGTGCQTCPKAANCPAAACPNAANCPAGKQCPNAAIAGAGCLGCPKAGNCPAGQTGPAPKTDDDGPPPPNERAKLKADKAKV